MKNTLFILAFLPLFAAAQERTVQTDTSYIQNVNGVYFFVRSVTYTDGGPSLLLPEIIGDTAAVLQTFVGKSIGESYNISNPAKAVMNLSATAKMIRQYDATCTAATTRSPLKIIQAALESSFLSGSWTINNGTTTLAVNINKNAQGVLRYTVSGSSAKTLEVLGPEWVVLKNYPSSPTDTHLFRVGNDKWKSLDGTVTFKK